MNFRVVTVTQHCFISFIDKTQYRKVLESVQIKWSSLYSGTNHSRALNHWLEWLGERFRMGGMEKREKSVEGGRSLPPTKDSLLSLFSNSFIVFLRSMETTFWSLRTASPRIGSSEKSFLLRAKLTLFFFTLISEHSPWAKILQASFISSWWKFSPKPHWLTH